ncbi:DUF7691 family protein [Embleya scabrispora]|uniref:DUF7691 family protein n=1 Tax=Embleya scabrispora TaxID=159449 RepID=UPI0003A411EE|nr:hypothetical protein [Embleya scabrispora]MYS86876.1 hypothetical protein [Streptomyces sp. SID5474]
MSMSLSLFLVDPEVTRAVVGSGDVRVRRAIGGRFKQEMSHDDDYFAHEIENGAPTRYEALTAVVDGGPFDEKHAFQYGYAYRMVCAFHGRRLWGNSFSPFKYAWLGYVDEALKSLGIEAVTVSEFGYGLPSPLPYTDLPGNGVWSPDACAVALAQYEAVTEEQLAALDREVREAVEEIGGWLREARAHPGRGVVGFLA